MQRQHAPRIAEMDILLEVAIRDVVKVYWFFELTWETGRHFAVQMIHAVEKWWWGSQASPRHT